MTVVGTGIQIARDLTPAARHSIESADKVFYLASDLVAMQMIEELNTSAESLHTLYSIGKPRIETYHEMSERIVAPLRDGLNTCVAVYGHPGVFAYPMHRAIILARQEGFAAVMLPAVSSVDCLFADLGIDPAERGLQIFDASDFVFRARSFDPQVALVLLQLNVVGEPKYEPGVNEAGWPLLVEQLGRQYAADHDAVVYSAAEFVWGEPSIQRVTIGTLMNASIDAGSTLYVPPEGGVVLDEEMRRRFTERLHEARMS